MDRDDIIRMAREAGFESHDAIINYPKELQRFAAIVAAAEREACALEVEKAGMEGYGTLAAAAAIRARSQNGL